MRSRSALLCLIAVTVTCVAAPAPAADAVVVNADSFVTMYSDPNVFSQDGTTDLWRSDSVIWVTREAGGVVDVANRSANFDLEFAAPPGHSLTAGTYTTTERSEPRNAGHAGIDVTRDGSAYCQGGRFVVHDIAADLSRLLITYTSWCQQANESVFGEVSINEPADADRLVTAHGVTWPDQYPGLRARSVPVNLINTGAAPLAVNSARITAGAPVFSVVSNNCPAELAPKAQCAVTVDFRPARTGAHTGALSIVDGRGTTVLPLRGNGISGHTSIALSSQPGDFIGAGTLREFTPANSVLDVRGGTRVLDFSILTPPDEPEVWNGIFALPTGQTWVAGRTYRNATDSAGDESAVPRLDVGGDGRGCDSDGDSFTVRQIAYNVDGEVTSLSLSFVQRCRGASGSMYGAVAWRAAQPAAAVPGENRAPATVTGVRVKAGRGQTAISWDNPITTPTGATIVRYARGVTAPATPRSGRAAYKGAGSGVTLAHLAAGADYSIAIFRQDTAGRSSAPVFATVRGSALALHATTTRVRPNHSATLVARLTDARTRGSVRAQPVTVYSRPRGSTTWTVLATGHSSTTGAYRLVVRPRATRQYRAIFSGAGHRTGAASTPVTVTVTT